MGVNNYGTFLFQICFIIPSFIYLEASISLTTLFRAYLRYKLGIKILVYNKGTSKDVMEAVSPDFVVLLSLAPKTSPSKHAALHQEGPHTREQASPEKPEVHPEHEPHEAEQQSNMI